MKTFNKKRLIISGCLFTMVAILIMFIKFGGFTLSRYESAMSTSSNLNTAIYLVDDTYQTISVKLPDVLPNNNQYTYTFSVSNFNANKHSDTNIKYKVHIRTTTNMHINYDLFNTLNIENANSCIDSNNIVRDSDGTFFRHIYSDEKTMLYSENKTDYYTILFTFPTDYRNAQYSGMADYIEVNIESKQVLSTDNLS